MCARMTKLEAIRTVKRANNRLKPVGDICYDFAYQRGKRLPEKEQQLMLARLERELSPDDTVLPQKYKTLRSEPENSHFSRDQ